MKIFSGICLILGCFLGAGFVSGREIAFYFAKFGMSSIVSIVVATIIFLLLTLFFLFLSDKFHNFEAFCSCCFGKYANIINSLLALSILIISGTMLAGTFSLADELNISNSFLVFITMVITFLTVMGNAKSITKVNVFLVPFLIGSLLCLLLNNYGNISGELSDLGEAICSGIGYVFINITTLGVFILEFGYRYNKKQKVVVAVISSVVIGVLLLLLTGLIQRNDFVENIMPNLSLAKDNKIIFLVIQISIYLGLLTTYIANIFTLSNYLFKLTKNRVISVVITLIFSCIISVIGFDYLVGYVYSVIGVVGLIIIIGGLFKKRERINPL